MESNIIYMAKPIYGGWVTFTAHLCLKYGCQLFKVGKRTEPNQRDYGYGLKYRNMRIDDLINKMNLQPDKIPDLDAISLMSGDTDKKSTDRGITLNL